MYTSTAEQLGALAAIVRVQFHKDFMDVSLSDGRILSIPLAWYPRLARATAKQLKNFEISPGGYGIHWPQIDEDLSVYGFLFPRGLQSFKETQSA
jgi:hypothetical protein